MPRGQKRGQKRKSPPPPTAEAFIQSRVDRLPPAVRAEINSLPPCTGLPSECKKRRRFHILRRTCQEESAEEAEAHLHTKAEWEKCVDSPASAPSFSASTSHLIVRNAHQSVAQACADAMHTETLLGKKECCPECGTQINSEPSSSSAASSASSAATSPAPASPNPTSQPSSTPPSPK